MANGYSAHTPGRNSADAGRRSGSIYGYGMRSGAAQPPYGRPVPPPQAAHAGQPKAQLPYVRLTGGEDTGRTAAGMQTPQTPPHRRGASFWVALAVVLLCVVLAAALLFATFGGQQKSSRAGVPGQLDGKKPEEVQAELDRVVEEGMFNISIASAVMFADGVSPGELRIENVPGNLYLMRVTIRLDDTGQQVYTTDLIEPNNHIQQDTLDVDLPQGAYNATAVFTAYDPDTEAEVGQAAAKITLLVQG